VRVLSGIQPTGTSAQIGNYLGALRQWVELQDIADAFYFVPDLHAITSGHDPAALAARTRGAVAELLAAGLDPDRCTLFVQSHVPAHTELAWVLSCITGYGEASRMTQFKDKAARSGEAGPTVGLFTYPILQAADILLYQADAVPVGDDQRQHLELTRDLATRFHSRFGPAFTVPSAYVPREQARIADLTDPTAKMSKSLPPAGTLYLLDPPAVLRRKVMRATTDSGTVVAAAPDKPGISNLLAIYAGLTGRAVAQIEADYAGKGYGAFKGDLADVVVGFAEPFQQRYAAWTDDVERLDGLLAAGAERARAVAGRTLAVVRERIGFLPAAR